MRHFRFVFHALAVTVLLAAAVVASAAETSIVPPDVAVRLARIHADADARTPVQRKMSMELLYSIRVATGRPAVEGVSGAVQLRAADARSRLHVTVAGNITPELQAFVAAQGGERIVALPEYHALSAWLPAANIEAVAARTEVATMRLTSIGRHAQLATGPQDPQGDAAHGADNARANYNVSGKGTKVCVISDDNGWEADAVANGSLPAGIDNVPLPPPLSGADTATQAGDDPSSGDHEGTAMLEIVYRLAPGAALGFATGSGGVTAMAANVKALANLHACNVIVDDIGYSDDPPFQDGPLGDAYADASENGVLVVSASGNEGNLVHGKPSTWEGDFVSGGPIVAVGNRQYELLPFAPGVYWNQIVDVDRPEHAGDPPPNSRLYWNDPLCVDPDGDCAAGADYVLFSSSDGAHVADSSPPEQQGAIGEASTSSMLGRYLGIGRNLSSPMRFVRLSSPHAQLQYGTQGQASGHSASAAETALSVGAVTTLDVDGVFPAGTGTHVHDSSSDGRRILFYDRNGALLGTGLTAATGVTYPKVDLAAADCISTDVPDFTPFCGTSAAAPHVAAMAALAWEKYPALSAAQIKSALLAGAEDIEAPGWDPASGFGIALAEPSIVLPSAFGRYDIRTKPQSIANFTITGLADVARYDSPCVQSVYLPTQVESFFQLDFNDPHGSDPLLLRVLHCTPQQGEIYVTPTVTLNNTPLEWAGWGRIRQFGKQYLWTSWRMPANVVTQGKNSIVFSTGGDSPGPGFTYTFSSVEIFPGGLPPTN